MCGVLKRSRVEGYNEALRWIHHVLILVSCAALDKVTPHVQCTEADDL